MLVVALDRSDSAPLGLADDAWLSRSSPHPLQKEQNRARWGRIETLLSHFFIEFRSLPACTAVLEAAVRFFCGASGIKLCPNELRHRFLRRHNILGVCLKWNSLSGFVRSSTVELNLASAITTNHWRHFLLHAPKLCWLPLNSASAVPYVATPAVVSDRTSLRQWKNGEEGEGRPLVTRARNTNMHEERQKKG